MPTFMPRSRKAERQIDRGGRFADAALAGGDRDDRGRRRERPSGPCCWPWPCVWRGPPAGRRALRRTRCGRAGLALGGQRDHRRLHAGHRLDGLLGALSHRLPGLHRRWHRRVIEKNTLPSLATMSDSVPVLGSGVPSGPATLPRLARTSSLVTGMAFFPLILAVTIVSRALWSTEPPQVIDRAKSGGQWHPMPGSRSREE